MIREVIDHERAIRDALRRLPSPAECRAIRETAGVSQRRAAAALDVSATTVSLWETGQHRPRGPHLLAYVDLLDELRHWGTP